MTSSFEPPDLYYFARKFYLSPVYFLGKLTSTPNLLLSFKVVLLDVEGMDKQECTGVVSIYKNHFKEVSDYISTITPPLEAQPIHNSLLASWTRLVDGTKLILNYCEAHDSTIIEKAEQALLDSNELLDQAARELDKLLGPGITE